MIEAVRPRIMEALGDTVALTTALPGLLEVWLGAVTAWCCDSLVLTTMLDLRNLKLCHTQSSDL